MKYEEAKKIAEELIEKSKECGDDIKKISNVIVIASRMLMSIGEWVALARAAHSQEEAIYKQQYANTYLTAKAQGRIHFEGIDVKVTDSVADAYARNRTNYENVVVKESEAKAWEFLRYDLVEFINALKHRDNVLQEEGRKAYGG